jgi:hypothetical protein
VHIVYLQDPRLLDWVERELGITFRQEQAEKCSA